MPPASSSPIRRVAVLVAAATLFLSVGPVVTAAQSVQGASDTVVVGPDETYDSIDAVAGTVVVRGTVTGDVSGVAGTVHVTESGTVGGDIAASAGTVRIEGAVDGDVRVAGGSVELSETGQIGGNFDVGAGSLGVDGAVTGDVRAGAGTITIGPNAVVEGEFRYDAEAFTQDPGATVRGGVVRDDSIGSVTGLPAWLGALYGLLANLLLGLLLLAIFPGFSRQVAARVSDSPGKSSGVGLLTLIAVPAALVLLALTVIGLPLSLVGAVVFGITVWVAVVYGQYAIGAWVLSFSGRQNRWLALLVGLVSITVVGAIPVLGGLFELVAFLLGLGGLMLALRETYAARRRGDTTGGRQATLDESASDTSTA